MGPEKRLYPVAFKGGIDTKTDPKQVIPGKLLDLQNGIFSQTGLVDSRWGYTALGTGIIGGLTNISKCAAVEGSYNNELLMYDGQNAYSYIAANNAWANRGEVVSVIQTNQQITRNSAQQLSPDSATLGGIQVYAWEDSRGGIRYSVVDQASGAFIVVDQPLFATGSRPKCVACVTAGVVGIFFSDGFGNLQVAVVNPSAAAAAPAITPLVSGMTTPSKYDIQNAANGNMYLAACVTSGAGTFGLNVYSLSMSGTPTILASNDCYIGAPGGIPPVCVPTIAIDASTSNFWVLAPIPTAPTFVRATLFHADMTGPYVNTAIISAAGEPQAATGVVGSSSVLTAFFEIIGANGNFIQSNTMTTLGALGSPTTSCPVFVRGCGLASKAFQYGGKFYINVATQTQQQSTYFTLDQTGNVVSKANAQLGGGYVSSSDYVLPECQQISSGIFQYCNLVKGIVNTEAGAVQALLGVNSTKLDFFDSNSYLSSNLGGELYVVGGILQRYDGARYTEVGFHQYPEGIVATPVLSGGAMADGVYGYAVTYEWIDNTGATEISTPSIVQLVTITGGGGAGSVQFTIPTLRLTKKPNVCVVVYRTVGAGGSTGQILYRVTSVLLPTYSNPAVDTITFTDTLSDASITSNGALYTQPLTVGTNPVLPNAAPPACAFITTFSNRIVISGGDLSSSLWYSQTAIANAPAQFASKLLLNVDPDGGPITALARMDDKLVIFKQTGIFYITGQGPTATGDQSDFGVPIQIPTGDVGCQSSNSIVLTPMGLLFQSLNGIYLLDRGLNCTYKGAPVEQYTLPTAQNLQITSATLVPNQWVIFTTSSSNGIALVYDYFYDQWSTFTNHPAFDSDLWLGGSNKFVWANASTGVVYLQTPGAYSDAGNPIPFSLTTAWLTFAQIQGYQRVYHAFLLGQYYSSHTLNVGVGYDYDDPFSAVTAIPVTGALGLSTFGSASPFGNESPFGGQYQGASVYQFRLDLLRKCQAVRFQITANEASPGGHKFSLSSLGLLIGVKAGGNKLGIAKQFGVT